MNLTGATDWLVEDRARDRTRYTTFGRAAYEEDNANDDHAVAHREDYSVEMTGATPPSAGFLNTEQTAECENGLGTPVVVAAGQFGGATQNAANAAALAYGESLLDCEVPEEQLVDYGNIVTIATSKTYQSVNGGSAVPAALMKVSYVDGAIDHHSTGAAPTPRWLIARALYVKKNVAQSEQAFNFRSRGPSTSGAYLSQAGAVADAQAAGLYWIMEVDGGAFAIAFDDSFFSDNAAGSPNSTFHIESVSGPACVWLGSTNYRLVGGTVGKRYSIRFTWIEEVTSTQIYVQTVTIDQDIDPASTSHDFTRADPTPGSGNQVAPYINPQIIDVQDI